MNRTETYTYSCLNSRVINSRSHATNTIRRCSDDTRLLAPLTDSILVDITVCEEVCGQTRMTQLFNAYYKTVRTDVFVIHGYLYPLEVQAS